MKRILITGLSVALLLTGCAASAVPPAVEKAAEPKNIYYLSGKIQAAEAADLSVAFAGRVEGIPAQVGDAVRAGDPMVVFEASEAAAQAETARAAYETAQANLDKARIGARPEQIRQAEALADSARIARDNAAKTFERNEALYRSGAISSAQLEDSKGQAAAAEASFRSADEQLSILKAGETKAYLAVLEKQVQQAQAAWTASQTTRDNRTVNAPFDGVVVACPAKIGETYSAQTVLISLENRERLTADAYGPASAAALFKPGQQVAVRVAEVPDKVFEGTVTWLGDTIDPKRRAVLVKVSLEPAEELMAGMLTEIGLKR